VAVPSKFSPVGALTTAVLVLLAVVALVGCTGPSGGGGGGASPDDPGGVAIDTTPDGKPVTDPASLKWVALGDSYSAGVGVDGGGGCGGGNPAAAYAGKARALFGLTSSHNLSDFKLMACGGAVASQVRSGQMAEAAGADIVTITVGGNDIGFSDFGNRCFGQTILDGCPSQDQDTDVLDNNAKPEIAHSWPQLHQRLVDLYVDIRKTMHAGRATDTLREGHLFVLTYPIPFSLRNLDTGWGCRVLDLAVHDNIMLANALAERLDEEIISAVADASAQVQALGYAANIHIVDWRSVRGSAAVSKAEAVRGLNRREATNESGICSDHPMTNFIYLSPQSYFNNSFHPTTLGYDVATNHLLAILSQYFPYDVAAARAKLGVATTACAVRGNGPDEATACTPP